MPGANGQRAFNLSLSSQRPAGLLNCTALLSSAGFAGTMSELSRSISSRLIPMKSLREVFVDIITPFGATTTKTIQAGSTGCAKSKWRHWCIRKQQPHSTTNCALQSPVLGKGKLSIIIITPRFVIPAQFAAITSLECPTSLHETCSRFAKEASQVFFLELGAGGFTAGVQLATEERHGNHPAEARCPAPTFQGTHVNL